MNDTIINNALPPPFMTVKLTTKRLRGLKMSTFGQNGGGAMTEPPITPLPPTPKTRRAEGT